MPPEKKAKLAADEVELRQEHSGDVIEAEVEGQVVEGGDGRVADGGIAVGKQPEKSRAENVLRLMKNRMMSKRLKISEGHRNKHFLPVEIDFSWRYGKSKQEV